MSILIRGGYDIFRKEIINVSLRRTNSWVQGIVLGRYNKVIHTLNPCNNNNLEIVKYNNTLALLVNDSIVYEHDKLFYYNIELTFDRELVHIDDTSIYNFIHYNSVNYYCLKHFNTTRNLN